MQLARNKYFNVLYISFKMLTHSRKKFIGMIIASGLSAFVIMQQPSIYTGITERINGYIHNTTGFDLWVMDGNSHDFNHPSIFQPMHMFQIKSVPGVLWTSQIYRKRFVLYHSKTGQNTTWTFIGVDPDKLIGLPKTILHGRSESLRSSNAVLVDGYSLQQLLTPDKRTVQPGDVLIDGLTTWQITGVTKPLRTYDSEPTAYIANNHLSKPDNIPSFILVKVKQGYDVHRVAEAIRQDTGLLALTPEEFAERSKVYFRDKTPVIIGFIVTGVIGFLIGLVIMWQIFSGFILTHIHQFGMLKMLGTSNLLLTLMVIFQAALTGGLGYGLGLILTLMFGFFSYDTIIAFHLTPKIALEGAFGTFFVVLFASYFSVMKMLRLDSIDLCRDLN